MRGRPLKVTWYHTADELAERLEGKDNSHRRERIRALLMIRKGATIQTVSDTIATNYRTIQRWIAWYRTGGLESVLRRIPGYAAPGRPSKLAPEQTQELVCRYQAGDLPDVRAATDREFAGVGPAACGGFN